MFTYFSKKLEHEYHHLSLWYFVSFFYGITFYLKSFYFFNQRVSFNSCFILCFIILSVLTYFIVFFRKKEKLIFSLFLAILFSFTFGVVITHVWTSLIMQEINNTNSKKIKMQSCIRLIVK